MLSHAWVFCLDIINNWPALVTVSIIVSWVYRRISKNQQRQLKDIQMHLKRIELLQSINHDYGLQIVSGIFDEYEALGGNHYAHDRFEKYKKEKEK